jgi:hypothetical protein
MSDERFLNELQARGDKQKLMQLFGALVYKWNTFFAILVSNEVGT